MKPRKFINMKIFLRELFLMWKSPNLRYQTWVIMRGWLGATKSAHMYKVCIAVCSWTMK